MGSVCSIATPWSWQYSSFLLTTLSATNKTQCDTKEPGKINLHLVEIVRREEWKTKLCSDCLTPCHQQLEEQQEFYRRCKHSEEVHTMLPSPDLTPMEEKLNYLKRNIYKALPNTRLESKTDSMAYNRVSIHLTTFKKAVVDSVKSLLEGQQWLAIIDYTVMAWAYVQATPVWENPSHNNIRKTCFKSLAASCMTALKKGNFKAEQCEEIRKKLSKLKADSDEIVICLKHLDEMTAKQQ